MKHRCCGDGLGALALLAALLAVAGCAQEKAPIAVRPATREAVPEPLTEADVKTDQLQKLSLELNQVSVLLPGRDDAQHRQLMTQSLDVIGRVLKLLAGHEPSGSFVQAQRVIESSRKQLETSKLPPDAFIDSALRSAYSALSETSRASAFEQAGLSEPMEELRSRLYQLDTVRGPGHQWVATQVVSDIAHVVSRMSDALSGRGAPTVPLVPATAPTPSDEDLGPVVAPEEAPTGLE